MIRVLVFLLGLCPSLAFGQTPSVDGAAGGWNSTATSGGGCSFTPCTTINSAVSGSNLTTTSINDAVIVVVQTRAATVANPVTGITAAGVVFGTPRFRQNYPVTGACGPGIGSCIETVEVWNGVAAVPLASVPVIVTVTNSFTVNNEGTQFLAFGLANTFVPANPFDPNPAMPAVSTNPTTTNITPSWAYHTYRPSDFLLSIYASVNISTAGCSGLLPASPPLPLVSELSSISALPGTSCLNLSYSRTNCAVFNVTSPSVSAFGGTGWVTIGDAMYGNQPACPISSAGQFPFVWINE